MNTISPFRNISSGGNNMANVNKMAVNIRKHPNNPNMFEFTVTTPLLRSQFRLPRDMVNRLRIELEKVLMK